MIRSIRVRHLTFVIGAAIVFISASIAISAQPRWNLISIVTDDQAQWSVGAYGNRDAKTPNMDRLANEGARFLNAFVCTPVCSPSRASFLAGRYGTQLGITDWINPKEARNGLGLGPKVETWPRVLQRNGYVTGLAGKWHLGELPQFHPTKLGFDFFEGGLAGGFRPRDPELEVGGKPTRVEGFSADIVMDSALRFLDTNSARPFALLVHFREPHLPYAPVSGEDSAPFAESDPAIPKFPNLKTDQVKQWYRDYYGAIHSVDRNLGRLLARLDALKIAARTIILFTSDHGYMIGHHGLHTKGNAHWIVGGSWGPKRPNMFDESIRVPLIVRWPGVVRPGSEIPEAVSNIDTFPTILSILGVTSPEGWRHEGTDFSPLLKGVRGEIHPAIFGQYDLHNGGLDYMRMIRADGWKLIRHHLSSGLDELYNLTADPGETTNLYGNGDAEAMKLKLQERLTAWQRRINDPLLQRTGE